MPRLLFSKTDSAIWISHLDLMRLFQRAFKRAGLPLKHTQGFNPRPSVSIALPLSVGLASKCELLDFDLDNFQCSCAEIKEKLSGALVDGVAVLDCYENGRKIRDISLLSAKLMLEYSSVVPDGAVEAIRKLFHSDAVVVAKKGKNGPVEQDILPMIRQLEVEQQGASDICITAVVCCQNPSLNPQLIVQAIERYLPEFKPEFYKCIREELFDSDMNLFR